MHMNHVPSIVNWWPRESNIIKMKQISNISKIQSSGFFFCFYVFKTYSQNKFNKQVFIFIFFISCCFQNKTYHTNFYLFCFEILFFKTILQNCFLVLKIQKQKIDWMVFLYWLVFCFVFFIWFSILKSGKSYRTIFLYKVRINYIEMNW